MARPIVTVYSEVSADGKTCHRRGASSKPMMGFEGPEVKAFRHELRANSDAIMVGSNTVRTDDPSLTVRHADGENPLRVIPASQADLPPSSRIFSDGGETLIAVAEEAPPANVESLREAGAQIVIAGETSVDLTRLLRELYDNGVRTLMVEGGATLLARLFHENLVDRLIIQHLPVIFGGEDVPCMVGGPALRDVKDAIQLELVGTESIGQHAVVTYKVRERG